MLTYAIDGYILAVIAAGDSTLEERAAVLKAIVTDPRLQPGSLLLLKAEGITEAFDETSLRERVTRLVQALAPRVAPVCALIAPSDHVLESHTFQRLAGEAGVRVGLFSDEGQARAWLSAYQPDAI